jgi:prepilin-type processing-associated H-X9-DG protein
MGISLLRGSQIINGDPNMAPLSTINTKGIALCPKAKKENYDVRFRSTNTVGNITTGITYTLAWNNGTTFTAWEITEPAPSFFGSYGFNTSLFNVSTSVNIYTMKTIFSFPILLDSDAPTSNNMGKNGCTPPSSEDAAIKFCCINRHDGYVNGLFMDWSARKVGLKELWTLKWHKDFDTGGPWTTAGGVQPEDWPKWMRGFKDY